MSDAAAVVIQLITTLGTVATVVITRWQNRRQIDEQSQETHKRLDTLNARVSGEHFPQDTPLSVPVVSDQPRDRPRD